MKQRESTAPSSADAGQWRHRIWLILAMLFFGAFVLRIVATRDYWPTYDSGAYISAAVALHQGLGLRDVTAPVGKPDQLWRSVPTWQRQDPQVIDRPYWPFFLQYPPLIPILLVPLLRLGGGQFIALQLLPIISGLIAIMITYRFRNELCPKYWRWVLLWMAGSHVTLFATRIQSETIMLPWVLLGVVYAGRAGRGARLTRGVLPSAFMLLIAAMMHVKVVFVAIAICTWLLCCGHSTWPKRMLSALLVSSLSLLPIALYMTQVTWADIDLLSKPMPYFRANFNNPDSGSILSGSGVVDVLTRAFEEGYHCLESTGLWPLGSAWAVHWGVSLAFYVTLITGLYRWYVTQRTLLPWILTCHVLGCVISPWLEPRMMVPIMPLLLYALVLGITLPIDVALRNQPRIHTWSQVMSACALAGAVCFGWAKLQPWRDTFSWSNQRRAVTFAQVAASTPEDSVMLVEDDHYSVALISGRSTLSLMPREWKNARTQDYLNAGGHGIAVVKPPQNASRQLLRYLRLAEDHNQHEPSFFDQIPLTVEEQRFAQYVNQRHVELNGYELLIGTIGSQHDSHVLIQLDGHATLNTRIHPRWLSLSSDDVPRLWTKSFPSVQRLISMENNDEG